LPRNKMSRLPWKKRAGRNCKGAKEGRFEKKNKQKKKKSLIFFASEEQERTYFKSVGFKQNGKEYRVVGVWEQKKKKGGGGGKEGRKKLKKPARYGDGGR